MSESVAGLTNSHTGVPDIRVGPSHRVADGWLTGTTVVLPPQGGAVAGVDVRGGRPGTRETELLDPGNLVDRVHAVVLTGGSALGLASVDGVMSRHFSAGVGHSTGEPGHVVPTMPEAVIFDLGQGGKFGHTPDDRFGETAYDAVPTSGSAAVRQGVAGAGSGAVAGGLKGESAQQVASYRIRASLRRLLSSIHLDRVSIPGQGSCTSPGSGFPVSSRHCDRCRRTR